MSQTGEKTEQPTAKRLRTARRKGQIAKSQDLVSALLLLAAVLVLALAGSYTGLLLTQAVERGIQYAATFQGKLDVNATVGLLRAAAGTLALALMPLFAVLFLLAFLASYLQVGGLFTTKPVTPEWKKLNPVEGFKSKFLTARPYLELGRTILKLTVCATIIGMVLWQSRVELLSLTQQPLALAVAFTIWLILQIGWKIAVTFLLLGAADYFLQRFLHRKELMMTKQEVKEESKETEGDPLFKHLRRQRHREILAQNLVTAVRQADCVVVNPTHVAVALQYDRQQMNAPTVVASGAELRAQRIRAIAQENGVPIVRDVPLARALYEVEVEEEIPEELYEAVAVVLRWIYQLAAEKGEVARHV